MERPQRNRWKSSCLLWLCLLVPLSAMLLLMIAAAQPSQQGSKKMNQRKDSKGLIPDDDIQNIDGFRDNVRTFWYDFKQWWRGEPHTQEDIQVILPDVKVSPAPATESSSSK